MASPIAVRLFNGIARPLSTAFGLSSHQRAGIDFSYCHLVERDPLTFFLTPLDFFNHFFRYFELVNNSPKFELWKTNVRVARSFSQAIKSFARLPQIFGSIITPIDPNGESIRYYISKGLVKTAPEEIPKLTAKEALVKRIASLSGGWIAFSVVYSELSNYLTLPKHPIFPYISIITGVINSSYGLYEEWRFAKEVWKKNSIHPLEKRLSQLTIAHRLSSLVYALIGALGVYFTYSNKQAPREFVVVQGGAMLFMLTTSLAQFVFKSKVEKLREIESR